MLERSSGVLMAMSSLPSPYGIGTMGDEALKFIDFLKLRASIGLTNADYLPGDNVWTYYTQSYSQAGGGYVLTSDYGANMYGPTTLGQMATPDPSREKSTRFNIGFDARLFGGLNLEFDFFSQTRSNIWVSGAGYYTALIGFDAPYLNQGKVSQHGFEVAANYSKKFGDVTFNVGANMMLYKNEIKDQAEEPRVYNNLIQTPVRQRLMQHRPRPSLLSVLVISDTRM